MKSFFETRDLMVRKAGMRDIHALMALINGYAAGGIMLPRTEFEMSENIRDFTVVYKNSQLIGCAALHFYTPTTAEVRSLAVEPAQKANGIGRIIVASLEQEAVINELQAIFAFTYVPEFFQKIGFTQVEKGELPLKAWRDCVRCPKFQCCDEIAMLKPLVPSPVLSPHRDSAKFVIQLPQLGTLVHSERI